MSPLAALIAPLAALALLGAASLISLNPTLLQIAVIQGKRRRRRRRKRWADHKEDDEVIVPNVSARSDNHIRSVPPIDLEQFDTGDHSSISLAEHEPAASSSDDDESRFVHF